MDSVKKMLKWRFVSKFVRLNLFVLIVAACMLHSPATLRADQFFEEFLGVVWDEVEQKYVDDYFDVYEGYTAEFIFNLTTTGETATLFDASGDVVDGSEGLFPTTDEQDFVQGAYQIDGASVDFTFSSIDLAGESVTIYSHLYDGEMDLGTYSYNLGNLYNIITGDRATANLTIDLLNLGLEQYLKDGRFITIVFAFESEGFFSPENDFRIDTASLTVEATPVPIPAGLWLLGSGLLGISGIRRKIKG